MNIIDMGAGPKISWTLDGLLLIFAGALTIDLDAETRDVQCVITLYLDAAGAPTLEGGGSYAAVLILPPRAYSEPPAEEAAPEPLPPDPEAATLQLWPIPNSETSE